MFIPYKEKQAQGIQDTSIGMLSLKWQLPTFNLLPMHRRILVEHYVNTIFRAEIPLSYIFAFVDFP